MIVFVHGVPETAAIWTELRGMINRESVALSLPGFGNPRPEGFGATKDDYVDWLVGELDQIDGPIDLVGHDWGAGFTFGVATAYGDRLHSWAADIGNVGHPDYVWHDIAQVWQTPGDGEAFVESQAATPVEERAALYEAFGVTKHGATEMAEGFDLTMGHCILDLYRSAVPNLHAHWGPWKPTSAPGLILVSDGDPFGDDKLAREVADALGAKVGRLEGAGHFWPYNVPDQAAAVLEAFWSSLD